MFVVRIGMCGPPASGRFSISNVDTDGIFQKAFNVCADAAAVDSLMALVCSSLPFMARLANLMHQSVHIHSL